MAASFVAIASTLDRKQQYAVEAAESRQALSLLGKAARLRPDLGEIHNNIGTTLVAMDKLADAVAEFAAAVELQPDSLAMRINLANGLEKAERFAEAKQPNPNGQPATDATTPGR